MARISSSTFVALVGAWLLLAACADTDTTPLSPSTQVATSPMVSRTHTTVSWHAQQAALGRTGLVAGASASLVRNAHGLSYRFGTRSLTPGAYTLWLVVIGNPDACAASPCTATDIFNEGTRSQVRFAAGHVVGGSGKATFAGSVNVGILSGWLADRDFDDPMDVEVHLVVNDHGPMLPEYMPGMIQTYRGGCSDASPFPAIFPPTALADGAPGPNTCRLSQVAIFQAS
jgi:hypothetical protein